MIVRQVKCKKCGVAFPLTYPEKLSDIGLDAISYCPACLRVVIASVIKEDGECRKR